MRYSNLRYGNPNDLAAEMRGLPIPEIAKRLRRSDRCIKNWLDGSDKMPFWVPELLRLQRMEHYLIMRQMNVKPVFGTVKPAGNVVTFTAKIATLPKGNNNENLDEYFLRDRA